MANVPRIVITCRLVQSNVELCWLTCHGLQGLCKGKCERDGFLIANEIFPVFNRTLL